MAAFNAAVASVAEEESDEEAPPEIELVELAKDASELERLEVTGERGGGGEGEGAGERQGWGG